MYDTIHLTIPREQIKCKLGLITSSIDNLIVKNIRDKGIVMFSGNISNFRVNVYDDRITMKGSLSKFYFGNNIQQLSISNTKSAIEILSEKIHIDLTNSIVTRIDIGAVFEVKHNPICYLPYLKHKDFYERISYTNSSLVFKINKRELAFYDKTLESKKTVIPSEFKNKNLLRYELRFMNRFKEQLNMERVVVKDLYDYSFSLKLLNLWKEEYNSIKKIKSILNSDINKIMKVRDATQFFYSALLRDAGYEKADMFLKEVKSRKLFSDPKNYTRLKESLYKNLLAESSEELPDLMKELDLLINDEILYSN